MACKEKAEIFAAFLKFDEASAQATTKEKVDAFVRDILDKYADVFPQDLPKKPPPFREGDHVIDLEPGHTPPAKLMI